jgi:HK97 family phage portal protein
MLSVNGVTGLSPIRQCKEAIAAGMSLQEMQGRFYSQSLMPSAVLKHPKKFQDPKTAARIGSEFKSLHQGSENAGGVVVLEEDMDLQTLQMSPKDAEWLASANLSLRDICNIFGSIPVSMLNGEINGTLTYGNRQDDNQLLLDRIDPLLKTIE